MQKIISHVVFNSRISNVPSQTLKITAVVECYNEPPIKRVWISQVPVSAMLANTVLAASHLGLFFGEGGL